MSLQPEKLIDPVDLYTGRDLSSDAIGLRTSRNPDQRNVSITDVQTTTVEGNFPWTLVRIYTDSGLTGTGEAYWGAGIPQLIKRMKTFLQGENPLDIDRLYKFMIQRMSGEGSLAGATVSAISGIEIALHDLAGKILGIPAYQLLGGKYRDQIRMYCDCHTGDSTKPEAFADEAERVIETQNYDAVKFDLDIPSKHKKDRINRHLVEKELQHKARIVEAVTERIGDRAEAAFDCHWAYSSSSARRLASQIEDCSVWWLEDPVPPENLDVQKQVTDRTSTPVAAGENVYRKHGHRQLIEQQAVDILTPDIPKVGGMRESSKIAEMADMYYIPIAFHNVCSPVGTMAAVHTAASLSNVMAVEFHSYQLDWWTEIVEEDLIDAGRITVPEKPGLGVTLNKDVLKEHVAEGSSVFD